MRIYQVTLYGKADVNWDYEPWAFYEEYFIEAKGRGEASAKARKLLAERKRDFRDTQGALQFIDYDVKPIASLADLDKADVKLTPDRRQARRSAKNNPKRSDASAVLVPR